MLSQNLSQKMLQKLSPQQIQLMKLLQIPTATIDQRIKEELEANPALEESHDGQTDSAAEDTDNIDEFESQEDPQDDAFDLNEYIEDYVEDDPISYRNTVQQESPGSIPIALHNTFHDYLEQQLGLIELQDERETIIAQQVLGSIDDDGYWRRDPASIIDDLMLSQAVEATEEEVLAIVQNSQRFDPPGVGARDLRECLLIQLRQKLEKD